VIFLGFFLLITTVVGLQVSGSKKAPAVAMDEVKEE
jgi:hypothetical protein